MLFADLVGYTALAEARDPEAVKNVVDGCFERLVADIVAFGGVVDKIVGDAIVALFGAPVAHEDDPERAVRAALRMQHTIAAHAVETGVDLRIRVGVNSGEALVGRLRAGGDYTAMGDVVNTASRLQVLAAPGQILVGPATQAATAGVIRYESLGLLRARGRDEPVPAWAALEALGRPGARSRPVRSPLVGRAAEFGLLRQVLATVSERRRAALVLLVGEAGIGKTRLVEELVGVARSEGALVLEGRCPPYGEVNVWAPIGEALRRAAGIRDDDGGAATVAKARAAIGAIFDLAEDAPEVDRLVEGIAPLLGKTSGVVRSPTAARARPGPTGGRSRSDSDAGGEQAVLALAACLERLTANRPLVFVIEELHWSDDALLGFLAQLLSRLAGQPVLVLATTRPELLERWFPPDGRHNGVVLHVDPLGEAASTTLLCHLSASPLAETSRDELVARSGGNPLWLEELAALADRDGAAAAVPPPSGAGGSGPTAGGPLGAAAGAAALPATLQGLIAGRLDLLAASAREVLEDAAVAGRSGSVATLQAMAAAAGRGSVEASLGALSEAGLVVTTRGGAGWAVRSELVREVAYQTLTKAERARRHARLAAWLSTRVEDDPPDDLLDALAYHWSAAARVAVEMGPLDGVPATVAEAALTWLGRAADRALAQERWLPAATLLDSALELVDGDRSPYLLDRARARVGVHDAEGAAADLAELRSLDSDDTVRGAALVVGADVARIQGRYADAERLLADALALARQAGDEHAQLEALRSLGQTRLFASDDHAAAAAAQEALELARRIGDRRAEAWALQHLAWTSFSLGDLDTARARLHESIDAFAEIGDWGGQGWAEGLLAWVTFVQGELDEAEVLGRKVMVEALRTGDVWAVAMMRTLVANIRLWSGAPDEAATEAAEAAAAMASLDDAWGSLQARLVWGRARLAVGDLTGGRRILEEAVADTAADPGGPAGRTTRAVLTVVSALQLGEGERALEALPPPGRMPQGNIDEVVAAGAVAHLQCGRVAEALVAVEPLLRPPGPDGRAPLAASAAPWVAVVLAAGGRRAEARAVLDAASSVSVTYLDRAWATVARLVLADEHSERAALADDAVRLVAVTGDVLAQGNIGRAVAALGPPGYRPVEPPAWPASLDEFERGVPATHGWARLWQAVMAARSGR